MGSRVNYNAASAAPMAYGSTLFHICVYCRNLMCCALYRYDTHVLVVGAASAINVRAVRLKNMYSPNFPALSCAPTRSPHLFSGGTAQDVLTQVDGNCTHPSPATPCKSPPGVSGSGPRTPPRTLTVERLTRNTRDTGAHSIPSTPSARGAGPAARPGADRGDGRAGYGAPAMTTPEVPGNRAAANSGRGLRPSGGKSRSHRKRRKGRTAALEGLPGITGRLENEEYREQQRVAVRRRWPAERVKSRTIKRGRTRRGGSRLLVAVEVRGQVLLLR